MWQTMAKIINECNLDKVRGICIVSTGYVQLPEPYKCPDQNRITFFVEKKNFSAGKLYNNLTEAHNTLKGVIEKYNIEFTRHHKINSYVSSKVIMENSSYTLYPNHTICILRPTRDGTQWRWHTWLWHMISLSTVYQIDTSSHHERTTL